MDKEKTIQVGDLVKVQWENIPWIHKVRVLYIPNDTGDCFKLYDEVNAISFNVQNYCVMELIAKGIKDS